MLVFSTSDKGGTGRTVTSCNVAYRLALHGNSVCYLDFNFESPTAGPVFGIDSLRRGTSEGGLHSYVRGEVSEPHRLDVWDTSGKQSLRRRPSNAADLVLLPGDSGGAEFAIGESAVANCADLITSLGQEFDFVLLDLSAGRSYATELVLRATALPQLNQFEARWLVFHRWTPQHVLGAAWLALGEGGILQLGIQLGHNPAALEGSLRFVQTAVVDPASEESGKLRTSQIKWLREMEKDLLQLADEQGIGRLVTLGKVPLDPVLQWREQLITDADVHIRGIANETTLDAFEALAASLMGERKQP